MDFIKISPTTNFKLNQFWNRIELHFKFISNLAYSLEFDLRLRSGQVCFGKRYEDDLGVIFDQWPNLHLGLDALSNQKILNVV